MVLTKADGFIEVDGVLHSLGTGRAVELPEEEIVLRLNAIDRFPELDEVCNFAASLRD